MNGLETANVIEKHLERHAKRGNRSYQRVITIAKTNYGVERVTDLPPKIQYELLKTINIEVKISVHHKYYLDNKEIRREHIMVYLTQRYSNTPPKTIEAEFNKLSLDQQIQEIKSLGVLIDSMLVIDGYVNHTYTAGLKNEPTHLGNVSRDNTSQVSNDLQQRMRSIGLETNR